MTKLFFEKKKKWNGFFFDVAALVAAMSEDPSRKVGAVIVGPNNEIRATGFNGLPRGVILRPERLSREHGEKYHWMTHAEQNAIYNAARIGVPLDGCAIYVTLFPCADCMRGLIQSGIRRVHCPRPSRADPTYARSFAASLTMAEEAGVVVILADGGA